MRQIKRILNGAYRPPRAGWAGFLISILFGLFIAFFLLFFKPFALNSPHYAGKNLEILFFGLISTLVLLVFNLIFPMLVPTLFSDNRWKVKHQMVFYLVILFIIATLNGFYINHLDNLTFSWANYWWIINRTIILGGIPICFIVLVDHGRSLKKNMREMENLQIPERESTPVQKGKLFNIPKGNKNEILVINEDDFHYAEAQGNYIFIHFIVNNKKIKELHRVSLTGLSAGFDGEHLKRCHRSYLVNFKKVEKITGNAQGLKLWLEHYDNKIPVSRKYIPNVRLYFSKT